ncbi:MAG: DUF4476 domain-containing protein [Candidatus Cloacimonetes bacterium]|nr:DUF4476 domain-containing protein [Candidatus Cloacimonadota bacterium]
MKKIMILVLLSVFTFTFAESISFESSAGSMKITIDGSSSGNVQSSTILEEIAARLEKLESKYVPKLNKLDKNKAAKLIDEIYELLALLPEDVSVSVRSTSTPSSQIQSANVSISIDVNEPVIEEEITFNNAMSESEFKQLLSNVENESFADDQTSVVRIAANSKYFTINQLVRLLELFSFSDDKINIVRLVYQKIVDKDNSHNLLGAFTYSDDKKEVEQIINK